MCVCMYVLVAHLCLLLCNHMDCSPSGSSVHGTLQARILEWVSIPFLRGSSQPWDQSLAFHNAGKFFAIWSTRKPHLVLTKIQSKAWWGKCCLLFSSDLMVKHLGFWSEVKVEVKVKSLSRVRLLVTPWTAAYQAPPPNGTFQARVLEWVAISFSTGSSWPRNRTRVSCIVGRRLTIWATR